MRPKKVPNHIRTKIAVQEAIADGLRRAEAAGFTKIGDQAIIISLALKDAGIRFSRTAEPTPEKLMGGYSTPGEAELMAAIDSLKSSSK